jgi:hypothetical protein
MAVGARLHEIDGQLGSLSQDLKAIDPDWAAKNPDLFQHLNNIVQGKGLRWAVMYGPSGVGDTNLTDLRNWLRQEANAFETAAKSITDKLPQ